MTARSGAGALLVLLLYGVGCGGGSTPASHACDPLAIDTKPIALAKIIGVGRDGSGVLYVMDQAPQGQDRLFVSDGMTLKRREVLGSGSGSMPDGSNFAIVTAGPSDLLLNVELVTDSSGQVSMGLVRGMLTTKTFTIGTQGETLEVANAGATAGYAVENLPGVINVEYLATLPDGRTLLVTRPEVDWSYEDFRVFVGTTTLQERTVANVSRGSFTLITFDLDGAAATARFTSSLSGGISTLAVGTQELPLTPSGNTPTDVTFLCL